MRIKVTRWRVAAGLFLALLLVLAGGAAWAHRLLFERTPGQFLDAAGVPIYYTDEGNRQGDAVLLIHGLAAHADINWRRPGINALLAPDFRVVSMDLRGHGLSGRPHDPGAYGIETVEDIRRVMDHLGIQRAHLAGYSLGGFLITKFATLHPDRCLSLAICASGWKNPDDPEPLRSPYKDDPETRLPPDPQKHERMIRNAVELSWNRAPVLHAGLLPVALGDYDPVKRIRDYFGDMVVDREAMRALKKGLGLFVVTADQLRALDMPTICFMGTNDGLKPYAMDLKQAMPQAELVLIEGADHITTVLYDDFQQGLRNFLLAHREKRGA